MRPAPPPAPPQDLPPQLRDQLVDLFRTMTRIRQFEERAGDLFDRGMIPGGAHLSVGQEAVAAGVMAHLRPDDTITTTHRCHGHVLAKGADTGRMFAELFGRVDGQCGGKGGSMHICDPSVGVLGANGIVGANIPFTVGLGFAHRYTGTDRVAVAFFGDGATNEGSFHEAANMASLYELPVLLVCENNGFGEYTPQSRQSKVADLAERAGSYAMPGMTIDGMDVTEVWDAARTAVERARAGGGPTLIEAKTYRYYDHGGKARAQIEYRTAEELASWRARDPLLHTASLLRDLELADEDLLASILADAESEIDTAVAFAENSPEPPPEALYEGVYA